MILDVKQILQNPELPNGCEITSLCEVLNYYGVKADKCDLADHYLPQSKEWMGTDPNLLYMGNPRKDGNCPDSGYYCFAGPILAAANRYLTEKKVREDYDLVDLTGKGPEEWFAVIEGGTPVIFWASLHFKDIGHEEVFYPLSDGSIHQVFHGLHCMAAKGVDERYVYIADPLGFNEKVEKDQFIKIAGQLGNRAAGIIKKAKEKDGMDEEVKTAEAVEEEKSTEEGKNEEPEVIESMDDYKEELEASLKQVKVGDSLNGVIAGVTDDTVLVDLKYFAQGVIKREDFTTDRETPLKELAVVGSEITAKVAKKDDGEGNIVLSLRDANEEIAWNKVTEALASGETFTVKVTGAVSAGCTAELFGIRAFIPASKLSASFVEDTTAFIGQEIPVRVITADREKGKLVLSGKEIAREKEAEQKTKKASALVPGQLLKGTVETIKEYGAFIRLENGVSGLVHISEVSEKRLKSLKGVLSVGQEVAVHVLSVKDGKVSLSMKEPEKNAEAVEEEETSGDYSSGESAVTGLAALLKGIRLN